MKPLRREEAWLREAGLREAGLEEAWLGEAGLGEAGLVASLLHYQDGPPVRHRPAKVLTPTLAKRPLTDQLVYDKPIWKSGSSSG